MEQFKTITPVHIATGNIIEIPSYHEINDTQVARYSFTDILSQMPANVLTNPSFLNELSRTNSSKKTLYKNIRNYVDYRKLNSLYTLDYTYNESLDDAGNDVSEQVNDLHHPYIPGSSIKGTLLNSWKYYLLKQNYEKVAKNLPVLFGNRFKEFDIYQLMSGKSLSKEDGDIFKDLYGCLQCQDIYFNKMELFFAGREGSGKNMDGEMIPIPYKECISPNQKTIGSLFVIDEFKLKLLKEKYKNSPVKYFIEMFTREKILRACNVFTKDILEVEQDNTYYAFYESFVGINEQIKQIEKELKKENTIVLRVGNSTNYFAKSVSYLVKKNSPEIFKKYFMDQFAPINKGKTIPDDKTIPKTRVIYSNGEKDYLPGFIKVIYD